jgi:uncharacterized repeat protein (TIGR03803 family)
MTRISSLVRNMGRTFFALSLTGLCATLVTPAHAAFTIETLATFTGPSGINPTAGVTFDDKGNIYGTTTSGNVNLGTVYEIDKGSSKVNTLVAFNGVNGKGAIGGVTFDSEGNLYGATDGNNGSNFGTIYKIAKGSNAITAVASFNGTNGSGPSASLSFDSSGNLFGTTQGGGANSQGTIFEIVKGSSAITSIASFNGANGSGPQSGITFDSSGNLFGTTPTGGAFGTGQFTGTVYEVAKGSTTISTVASFNATTDIVPGTPMGKVAFDSSGNIFGTTSAGGYGNGTIYEIPKGRNTAFMLALFYGNEGAQPLQGVVLDGLGNIFGVASKGGANGDGSVFELAKGKSTISALASFDGTNGRLPLSDLSVDSSGDLVGTTYYGGPDNGSGGGGTVFEVKGVIAPAAVPETSSAISLALLLGLGGTFLVFRKRRTPTAK